MAAHNLTDAEIRNFAREGARQQLARILELFPELHTPAVAAAPRTGRQPMTEEQRRAVSQRMRKYWAQRRKANGGAK